MQIANIYQQRYFPGLLTLLGSALNTLLFWLLQLPLPFLFGPLFACLLMAIGKVRLHDFGKISVCARTVLGVTTGASVTPALFDQLSEMVISIAFIPVYLALIAVVGVLLFRYVFRFDAVTAFYAAMPGGLQDMVLFGAQSGGDVRTISLLHATRVLFIVTLAPVFLILLYDTHLSNPIGQPASSIPPTELGMMVFVAIAGWKVGEKIGLFGASLLGPMILAAILSMSNLMHFRPPEEAILTSQFFIGMGIGVHFIGITLTELRKTVSAGIAHVLLLSLLASGFAYVVRVNELAGEVEAFLSFAPGGQAEMMILAIATGADLAFVLTHHLTRMLLVITGAPIVARILMPRPSKPPD